MVNIIFDNIKVFWLKGRKVTLRKSRPGQAECYMQCNRSSKMAEKHHDEGDSNREYHPNSSDMFSGNFPEGLRVLVFDKDQKYLMELKKHLQEFQYEGNISWLI